MIGLRQIFRNLLSRATLFTDRKKNICVLYEYSQWAILAIDLLFLDVFFFFQYFNSNFNSRHTEERKTEDVVIARNFLRFFERTRYSE